MKYYTILFLLSLLQVGCQSTTTENSRSAENSISENHFIGDDRTKELMAIHDSIMPKMSVLMRLKSEVNHEIQHIDSLRAIKPARQLSTRKEEGLGILLNLQNADTKMMDWMYQFKADTLHNLSDQKASQYIADQKLKILEVKRLMLEAINRSELYLGNKENR